MPIIATRYLNFSERQINPMILPPAQHHTVPLENLVNYKIKDNVIICANLNSDAAADNTAVAILHTFSKHLIKPMIQRKAQNDNAQRAAV